MGLPLKWGIPGISRYTCNGSDYFERENDEQIDFQTDFGVLHFQTNSCGELNVVTHIPFTQVDHFGDIQNHTKNGVCVCLGLSPLRVTIKPRLVLPTTVW